jgi:chorismate mutase/prephenate dehydratase
VDIDGHASEKKVQEALEALAQHCTFVKILGTYPKTLPP